jgi:DNA uptake protein ComE-like DNA-binding protein
MLDWLDADSEQRSLGAENEYYAGLSSPYSPRNGLPETLEELLLVKGVTRALLFGADANYNRQIDPDEAGVTPRRGGPATPTSTTPWSWLLTLHSAERNQTATGQPRINLNGMNLSELNQKLSAATTPQFAAFVVAYRQHGPAKDAGTPTPGAPPLAAAGGSPQFKISSVLELAGAKVAIPAEKKDEKPKVYDSPLPADPQGLAAQLPKLLDATTVQEQPVLAGLVSVNHAPYEVLRSVPGIDETLAQRIVAARSNASAEDDGSRQFATWLLTEGLVDLETMKRLMPYVTGGGHVIRAQIVAHYNKPAPMARAELVIDATARPPRTVLWRDLRSRGPGFAITSLLDERTLAAGEGN